MTSLAIVLVLASAFTHALWNFSAKRAIGGLSFLWLFGMIEVLLYLPFTAYILSQSATTFSAYDLFMMAGSALLHIAYFFALTWAYQLGDLSIVYPLSRGIAPLFSTIAAVMLFAERPSPLAIMGTSLITLGIIGLTGDPRKLKQADNLPSLFYALLTGISVAAYTLWDSHAVRTVSFSPIVLEWGMTFIRILILTPLALRRRADIQSAWQFDKWKAVNVAVLSSISYIFMLFAMSSSPVSYVAPLRSISTLMGVVMGAYLLKEGDLRKRVGAASLMVIGAIALGLG